MNNTSMLRIIHFGAQRIISNLGKFVRQVIKARKKYLVIQCVNYFIPCLNDYSRLLADACIFIEV